MTLKDLEQVDVDYYNSLVWIQDNDPTCLNLTCINEKDMFGELVTTELTPGGSNIPVTQKNKDEYIKLVIQDRFQNRVRPQMENVMQVLRCLAFKDNTFCCFTLVWLGPGRDC